MSKCKTCGDSGEVTVQHELEDRTFPCPDCTTKGERVLPMVYSSLYKGNLAKFKMDDVQNLASAYTAKCEEVAELKEALRGADLQIQKLKERR